MSKSITLPELTRQIALRLPSPDDIANLSRCSRHIRTIVTPVLYRNIEFSLFKSASLNRTLVDTPALSKYCRKLSIEIFGEPSEEEAGAYSFYRARQYYYGGEETRSDDDEYLEKLEEARSDIRSVLKSIIQQCSAGGTLKSFSWRVGYDDRYYVEWILNSPDIWSGLLLSRAALEEFNCDNLGTNPDDFVSEFETWEPFAALSKLSLNIVPESNAEEFHLRRFVKMFPNVRDLRLEFYSWVGRVAEENQALLNYLTLPQLRILDLKTDIPEKDICTDAFLQRHPLMVDLAIYHTNGLFCLGTSSSLRALSVKSYPTTGKFWDQPQWSGFRSLSMVRVDHTVNKSHAEWLAFMGSIRELNCFEECLDRHRDMRTPEPSIAITFPRLASNLLSSLKEFGLIVRVPGHPFFDDDVIATCISSVRLETLLKICSECAPNLRAVRLVYMVGDPVGWIEDSEKPADLPTQLSLTPTEIPINLKHILWEVPWMLPRLYIIERNGDDAIMVYTGRHHLPDRRFSKRGSWTDESIYDHMGLDEKGEYSYTSNTPQLL